MISRISILACLLWALALVQAYQTADSLDMNDLETRQNINTGTAGTGSSNVNVGPLGSGTGSTTGTTGTTGTGTGTGVNANANTNGNANANANAANDPNLGMTVMPATCLEYSRVANYSTIGTNSTYRASFQQASPHGTDQASGILDSATAKLPDFKFNAAINARCGNLSQVAVAGAEANFTQGIVAEFRISAASPGLRGGLGMMVAGLVVAVGMVVA